MSADRASSWFKLILGCFFVVIGSAFTYLMWHSYERSMETREWPQVTAVVLASQVQTERPTRNSPPSYRANMRYRFVYEGKTFESRKLKRDDGASNKKQGIQEAVDRFPVGSSVTCYVNPSDPTQSVLDHTSKAGLYTIWFPFLFVVLGLGVCLSVFRAKA